LSRLTPLCKSSPIPVDLFQVVDDTKQLPLGIHLGFGSQAKIIQSDNPSDMGKGRFVDRQSHTVNHPAFDRVDLAFHLLGERFFTLFSPADEIRHLTGRGTIRIPQKFEHYQQRTQADFSDLNLTDRKPS